MPSNKEADKRVFISYSHDSEYHKHWVLDLAEYLVRNGIEVVLDQWDVKLGDDLAVFMERGVRNTDRVIAICTDTYVTKANSGAGGVGYEKTIATAEILRNSENRRKFIPIVRDAVGEENIPAFFGAALYLDLSEGNDSDQNRRILLRDIYEVPPSKPALGASPFIPKQPPPNAKLNAHENLPSLQGKGRVLEFSDRFSLAFPGVRGIQWFDDADAIVKRLSILLRQPLTFEEGELAGWWRGPENLHIGNFEQVEGRHFLLDIHELNIRRIAAVNNSTYYRKFIYVEADAGEPTGLYPASADIIEDQVQTFGYASEEYGLVDNKLPVTRAEYDDSAAMIDDTPVDISGRVSLRIRHIRPYNFLIAPFESPINNSRFDHELREFLNHILLGKDFFQSMCQAIEQLPKRDM